MFLFILILILIGSCCIWECRKDPKTNHIYIYGVEYLIELVPQKYCFLYFISNRPRTVTVHPHLFGMLLQTEMGISFLKGRLDLIELCKILSDENETLSNRLAVLWSIAHIAIQPKGLDFLYDECHCDFIDIVISLAENSSILSLRGTSFLVLSYLSSSETIRPIIRDHGWFCECYSGNPICYPLNDHSTLFNNVSTENWILPICTHFYSHKQIEFKGLSLFNKNGKISNHEYSHEPNCPSDILILHKEITKEEENILYLICKLFDCIEIDIVASLSSVVLCQEARRKLVELRVLSPSLFKHRIIELIRIN